MLSDSPPKNDTTFTVPLSKPGSPPVNPFAKPKSQEIDSKPGFVTANDPLDEGTATLQLPETLSKDSFHDLEYWIKGILKRAKRKAGVDGNNQDDD